MGGSAQGGFFCSAAISFSRIARTPLDEKAKSDLVRLMSSPADPFKGKTGDFERHYLLKGANEIMPYRVYVPTGYTASKALFKGNRRLKDEKILPEIKLAPRQIFTRSKVRADVNRIFDANLPNIIPK